MISVQAFKRNCFFIMIFLILSAFAPCTYAEEDAAVSEKISLIIENLITPGMSERDKALVLHDWLTENSYYDLTFTYFGPEGVLLHQTGVCESYAKAYQLLLKEAGIESILLTGKAKREDGTTESHAWNLVRIDGKWRHVDVTWDDPVDGGAENKKLPFSGLENHLYFLAGNSFILEDHIPDTESAAQINNLAAKDDLSTLPDPVNTSKRAPVPDFALKDSGGSLLTRDSYGSGKKMIMVYGRLTCGNTRAFLSYISPYLGMMKKRNVTVLLVLVDDDKLSEMKEIEAAYPGLVCAKQTSSDNSLWDGLRSIGYNDMSVTFPVIFLKNAQNKLTYCSTGFIDEPLPIVAGALAMTDDPSDTPPAKDTSSSTDSQKSDSSKDTSGSTDSQKSDSSKAAQKTVTKITVGNGTYKLDLKKKTASLSAPKNKSVKTLTIPASVKANKTTYKVTSISNSACKNLKKLTTVTVGKNVGKIGKNAFSGCKKLKKLVLKTGKLKLSSVGVNAFKGSAKMTVTCPASKRNAYQKMLVKRGVSKKSKFAAQKK